MNLFKKYIPFCFLVLFWGNTVQAQCPQGEVILATQAAVDSFAVLYPDCTTVDSLWIGTYQSSPSTDIADLSPLSQITSIIGYLCVEGNDDLITFNGLQNLTSIGDYLSIQANPNLLDISAFGNLTSLGSDLLIGSFNYNLSNLNGLENLTSIAGNLIISGNYKLADLSGLANLTSVVGTFTLANTDLLNLNDLGNLTTVGGNFDIVGNDNLTDLVGLGSLTSIGDYLGISSNFSLVSFNGLDNLTSIGGDFLVRTNFNLNTLSGFTSLTSIGGKLLIEFNGKLANLTGLGNLTSVGGDFNIRYNSDLVNLTGLENLTSIGSSLIIDNSNLVNLVGMGNLTSVGNSLNIHDNINLVNLEGLENLASIEENLFIRENGNLINLVGLEGLTSIGGDLKVRDNENLINLTGLEGLTSIGDKLWVTHNYKLRSLLGLQNIDFNSIEDLDIFYNVLLTTCSFTSICLYLENGNYSSIYGNDPGCDNKSEILDACSFSAQVQADIFYDINQNKIQDADEVDYHDYSILIEPGGNSFYTQNNGIIYLEQGNYTLILDETNNPNWQVTTDSISYFLDLEESEVDTITFGIYPTQQISHIQTVINSPPARCNEVVTLDVTTKNLGTTVASGTMWLTIDDAVPEFSFIHEPDTLVENVDIYYGWYFTDLYPGQSIIKNVAITVPGPPDFFLGQQLMFASFSEFTDVNGEDSSENFPYNPEVRCSYDPNDKLVNPNREGDYALFDEDLIYTIRFQNTGNDVAYDVVIRDTLDANLNLSTFRVLGSSHADRLNTILNEDEGILTFEFRDIFLPDSTSNFEGSQGYVSYLIETIDGLAENTPVTNSAGIYFDLNPPVITNTTQSIMVSELPTVSTQTPENSFDFNISPNPNTGTFTVQGIPIGTYQILNTSGQIIRQGDMQNDLLIDISREAQGVYFISVTIDNETFVQRIMKM